MSQYRVVFVTASNVSEAEKIAQELICNKLAACVSITEKIKSIYRWQGKIECASEVLMIIKTNGEKIQELIKAVKQKHSYTVPEVITLPILEGNEDYLNWIDESVE